MNAAAEAPESTRALLLGAGALARSILGAGLPPDSPLTLGIVDPAHKVGDVIQGCAVVARSDGALGDLIKDGWTHFLVGVGAVNLKGVKKRIKLWDRAQDAGLAPLIMEQDCGPGTVMGPLVVRLAGCTVGDGCLIGTGSILEHDTTLGNHVVLGPGVVLCGDAVIEDGAFIGAGAVVIQGKKVKAGTLVAAGEVVR